jgi:hypothetical protein
MAQLQALKTGYHTIGKNRLQDTVPEVFLQLKFKDPEGDVVVFPKDVPVIVEFGADSEKRYATTTGEDGTLRFTAEQVGGKMVKAKSWFKAGSPWHSFSLRGDTENTTHYIVCDRAKPAKAVLATTDLNAAVSPPIADQRYFGLPRKWMLQQIELDAAPTFPGGEAVWTEKSATITHKDPKFLKDIGTEAAPIVLILKLKWTFWRFEFFDRHYGHEGVHGDKRVSVPPVRLRGFRKIAPVVADPADADSNWTIPAPGSAAKDVVQCLPWVLHYDTTGSRAALPKLKGGNMGLLFETEVATFVQSKSATDRTLVKIPANDARRAPKAERLDYYDLPTVWKSQGYYTRVAAAGKFFKDVTDGEVAYAVADRLAFSLDDLVLTSSALAPVLLDATHRVALFHHKFAKPGAGTYTDEGIYEPGADSDATNWEGYPYSKPDVVKMLEAKTNYDAAQAAGKTYYIHIYPDWTRLVLAQGNMFDVFEKRTPDGNAVVGARAAVRWVDSTSGTYGTSAGNAVVRKPLVLKPAADANATFGIQTYYEQQFLIDYGDGNPELGPKKHIEWTTQYATEQSSIGRYDLAMLRCTDRDGNDEVATVVRYHRLCFDFESPDGTAGVPVAQRPNPFKTGAAPAPPVTRTVWLKTAIDNMGNRWNGHDAVNTAKVEILPRPVSPPTVAPALKVKVVNVFQAIKKAWSHYYLITINARNGSAVGGGLGSGRLRVNCTEHDGGPPGVDTWGRAKTRRGLAAAHEMGHSGSLPDDYVADDHLYAHLNLLGSPYVHDARNMQQSLMMFNWEIRARYLWHAAEWLRLWPALQDVDFKIKRDPGELNYFVPHYPHGRLAGAASPRHFVNWPVSFNVWASAGNNSIFDAVLYILGEDKYSTDVLRQRIQPVAAGRVDGILVVMVRVEVDLTAALANGVENDTLDYLHTATAAEIDNLLNFTRCGAFQLCVAGGGPTFSRCYVHFMLSMARTGAAALGTANPHMKVSFDPAASPPQWNPSTSPPANAKTLKLPLPANFNTLAQGDRENLLLALAPVLRDRVVQTLGLSNTSPADPHYYLTPAAYKGFIQAVAQAGIPDPNVT